MLKEQKARQGEAASDGQVALEQDVEQTRPAAVIPRAQTRLQQAAALEFFVAQAGEAGVAQMAATMGLPRASAHILLST